jgi:hypothetical protein
MHSHNVTAPQLRNRIAPVDPDEGVAHQLKVAGCTELLGSRQAFEPATSRYWRLLALNIMIAGRKD